MPFVGVELGLCLFNIAEDASGVTWWTNTVALAPKERTLPTPVPGNYVVLDAEIETQALPFRAERRGPVSMMSPWYS